MGAAPTWTQPSPTGGPPTARYAHTAVYDAGSNRMVVYGGRNFQAGPFGDVWVLTNATASAGTPAWTTVSVTGPTPEPRGWHTAAYDPVLNRMIVFAGISASGLRNDVWVLRRANGLSLSGPAAASPLIEKR